MNKNNVLTGDCRELLKTLPEKHFDCCITSPPYYGLRDYGVENQIGLESTADEYINQGKEFFMACLNAKCEHIAVENPVPMSVVGLPEYDQIIEPYWFGDPYSKRTCLWLKNLPKLKPTNMLRDWQVLINGGGGRLEREHYKDKQFANTAKARSKTFKGVAEAMAAQWTDTYQVQMQMEL